MSFDLTKALQDWPFEPGQINVRLIQGDDGLSKVQMRVDLGILQMETEGRPDGSRPMGFDTLLDYHETRLEEQETALRRVLTLLIDWAEADRQSPDLSLIRESAA